MREFYDVPCTHPAFDMALKMQRISSRKDFEKLFKRGFFVSDKALNMKCLRNGTAATRAAFVVSTKVSKSAVVRNTIRRRLREIFRVESDHVTKGVDILFIASPICAKVPFTELKSAVRRLLLRARLVDIPKP